ncbi:hypothetical protein [Streptomyces griseofuscus]
MAGDVADERVALGVVHDLADQAAWPEDLGRPELRDISDDFEPP